MEPCRNKTIARELKRICWTLALSHITVSGLNIASVVSVCICNTQQIHHNGYDHQGDGQENTSVTSAHRLDKWLLRDSFAIKMYTVFSQRNSWAYYSQGDIDTVSQNDSPSEHRFAWTMTLWGGLQKCCNRMILCRPILITVWALHCIFRLYMEQFFRTGVVLCRLCDCSEHRCNKD